MKKLALIILDGWGVAASWGGNAVSTARPANFYKLLRTYPNTTVEASGTFVGLPGDEVGNSEVGHMNLGSGNIIEQAVSVINKSIEDGDFFKNKVLIEAIQGSKQKGTNLHLLGILSDASIHANINHLLALIKLSCELKHQKVFLHLFTDGRDNAPYHGLDLINEVEKACNKNGCGKIATIMGRVMLDRKGNWLRTLAAYNALLFGTGRKSTNALSAMSQAYREGETDEYLSPIIINNTARFQDDDTLIFFNFRSDRTRQMTQALMSNNFNRFKRNKTVKLNLITFIPYGIEKELNIPSKSVFAPKPIDNTIGGFYAINNLKQFHIAETEKFAHVTFFINGNRQSPYKLEDRLLIPSPSVASYAQKPQMSAEGVKNTLVSHIKNSDYHFYICNFANGDMVGHTGDFRAALAAVSTIDALLKELAQVCLDTQTTLVITADHGNVEQMVNPVYGGIDTEHTNNPVPFIIVDQDKSIRIKNGGRLSNVASTCLKLSGFESPKYFDESLI